MLLSGRQPDGVQATCPLTQRYLARRQVLDDLLHTGQSVEW